MDTKTPLDSCSSGAIDDTCTFNYETFDRRKKNSCWLMETASVIPCKFLKERLFQESCEFFVNSEKGMLVKCEFFVN